MQRFTNPLDNIHIASPCSADWNEMFGNDRKRFCGDCKLNVYNLSDMNRSEAESFLLQSEHRVCVRFFRRNDGTVLTKDCPVGWQALKRRVSRAATAVFSMFAGLLGGVLAVNLVQKEMTATAGTMTVNPVQITPRIQGATMGDVNITEERGKPSNLRLTKGEFVVGQKSAPQAPINRVEPVETGWEGKVSNLDALKDNIRSDRPGGKR